MLDFPKSPLVEHSVRRPGFSLEKNGFTRVKRGAFLCSRKPHAVTGLGSSVQQGKGAPVPIQPGDKRLNGCLHTQSRLASASRNHGDYTNLIALLTC